MQEKKTIDEEVMGSLIEAVTNGGTLKDILNVSKDTMDSMYAYAYEFYHQGKLDEAEKFFEFLCMYDLHNADYFLGLGAVYQLKKQYEKACDFYALSFALATNDYNAVFYTGQCQMLLNNIPRAMKCFRLVAEKSKNESIVTRSTVYLESITTIIEKQDQDPI